MSLIQTVPLGGVEFGEKASAADVAAAKAAFQPMSYANLRLWEIYDEDGAEIEVGEVRKTIDGVKKKKPLYKKVYTAENASGYPHILGDIPTNSVFISGQGALIDSDGWTRFGNYHEASDVKIIWQISDAGKVCVYLKGFTATYAKFEYRYTKTTDEWQPI